MTESTWNQTALDIVNATRDQYQTSDKLNMRINMHAKYSVNKESFGKMISSYYTIQPGDCILELGAGTGDMWLSEVHRVLKDGGKFCCATYGEHGVIPFIANMLKEYNVEDRTNKRFTLQNGGSVLEKHFSRVSRHDYEDHW